MQGGAGLQAIRMMSSFLEGGTVRPGGVPGGVYRTDDGWISVAVIQDRDWPALCRALEQPALAADPRYASREGRFEHEQDLQVKVRALIAARTSAELARRLTEAGLLFERVNDYAGFLTEPRVVQTGAIAWLTQPDLPRPVPIARLPGIERWVDGTPRATAPRLGKHTAGVLAEHGYSGEQIDQLAARGVIALARG